MVQPTRVSSLVFPHSSGPSPGSGSPCSLGGTSCGVEAARAVTHAWQSRGVLDPVTGTWNLPEPCGSVPSGPPPRPSSSLAVLGRLPRVCLLVFCF